MDEPILYGHSVRSEAFLSVAEPLPLKMSVVESSPLKMSIDFGNRSTAFSSSQHEPQFFLSCYREVNQVLRSPKGTSSFCFDDRCWVAGNLGGSGEHTSVLEAGHKPSHSSLLFKAACIQLELVNEEIETLFVSDSNPEMNGQLYRDELVGTHEFISDLGSHRVVVQQVEVVREGYGAYLVYSSGHEVAGNVAILNLGAGTADCIVFDPLGCIVRDISFNDRGAVDLSRYISKALRKVQGSDHPVRVILSMLENNYRMVAGWAEDSSTNFKSLCQDVAAYWLRLLFKDIAEELAGTEVEVIVLTGGLVPLFSAKALGKKGHIVEYPRTANVYVDGSLKRQEVDPC